jgi:type I restriction enzyme S subunit
MKNMEGWIRTTLGDVATLVKGIPYASEDYFSPGEGAVFITIKCVSKSGGFKIEGVKYFKGSITDSQVLQPGELLIANTDLTRAGDIVGCPIIIPMISDQTITMSMDLSKLVEDDTRIDRNFLYYKLMTDPVRRFMKDHASGSTVLHLQTRAVPSLELEIPTSKPEQTKIAEILSTVDRVIEQTEALIAKQQRIKTGLMQDLLTRGIDEHGNIRSEETHQFNDSPLGRIPVEWEVRTIDELAVYVGSGITPRGGESVYTKEGVLFIRSQNVHFGGLELADASYIPQRIHDYMKKSEVFENDVLINITGASIGRCCCMPSMNCMANVNQHVCVIRLDKATQSDAGFLTAVLESSIGQDQIHRFNAGGNREGLNYQQVRSFVIPWPKMVERQQLYKLIRESSKAMKVYCRNLQKLRSLKTALMQDLLTGKVRVTPLLDEMEVIGDESGQNTPVHQDRRAQPCGETPTGSACRAGVGDY